MRLKLQKGFIRILSLEQVESEELSVLEQIENYKKLIKYFVGTSQCEIIELPSANVIKINFENGECLAVRPSGTEPKLKIYYSAPGINKDETIDRLNRLKEKINKYLLIEVYQ